MFGHIAALGHGGDHAAKSRPHLNSLHVAVNDDVEREHAVEEAGVRDVTAALCITSDLSFLGQALGLLRVLDEEDLIYNKL